jgi:hypothetical protein
VRVDETESLREGFEKWRGLRAHFASFTETHASVSFRIFLRRGLDAARLWPWREYGGRFWSDTADVMPTDWENTREKWKGLRPAIFASAAPPQRRSRHRIFRRCECQLVEIDRNENFIRAFVGIFDAVDSG